MILSVSLGLQIFCLTCLSFQDIRTERLSLLLCFVLFMVSLPLMLGVNSEQIFAVFIVLGSLYLFSLLIKVHHGYHNTAIGIGDFFVLPPLLLSLDIRSWPTFLIISGITTLFYLKGFQKKKAPLVPFLALSYGVCLLL